MDKVGNGVVYISPGAWLIVGIGGFIDENEGLCGCPPSISSDEEGGIDPLRLLLNDTRLSTFLKRDVEAGPCSCWTSAGGVSCGPNVLLGGGEVMLLGLGVLMASSKVTIRNEWQYRG